MSDATNFSGVSPLVPLSKEQLGQVEYLIQQSIRGNHVLFDPEMLRLVLDPVAATELLQPLTDEEAALIESHIECIIRQPTLTHKRTYLETLDLRSYAWVVKTYFNIIESNLLESQEVRH